MYKILPSLSLDKIHKQQKDNLFNNDSFKSTDKKLFKRPVRLKFLRNGHVHLIISLAYMLTPAYLIATIAKIPRFSFFVYEILSINIKFEAVLQEHPKLNTESWTT
ncbi:hypothetical protein BpHYR1_047050 [Brachionus plicatilis]|uniref:Uncharacterized protein n=1 Tax=Brachionus plicatilis TaxID=10195 RepID=A0A3M7RXS4_BRAPC|nr:hypothetical protein BpHYR1_047050 [Brachionus plicatilis]